MPDEAIKAIIFDLGNVVIDFDHTISARRISRFSSRTPKEIFDLFFDSELIGIFEEGKISPQDFFLEVKKILGLQLEYKAFLPIWNEIFFLTEKNRYVYNLAKMLKRHYKVALLSNINVLHYEYLRQNFPVFDAFTDIITSFELGFKKPHPAIYHKTLEVLGELPGEVFYTDDRAELVEKARALGINSHCFSGVEKLKEDFLYAGLDLDRLNLYEKQKTG